MSPRGRWNRKLRDRIRRPAASRLTASGSPSTPSYAPTVERERDRADRAAKRPAADAPSPQRMWKVGELSMQTRFDSR